MIPGSLLNEPPAEVPLRQLLEAGEVKTIGETCYVVAGIELLRGVNQDHE
jgi:hypothetical protein